MRLPDELAHSRWMLLIAAILALAACGHAPAPSHSAPPPLATFTVQAHPAQREQVWDGVVQAVNETTLTAQTNARVQSLPVDVGTHVTKGQVLVNLTDVEQTSGRRAAAANVAAAQAAYHDADLNWQRTQEIFNRGFVARAQLDQAVAHRDATRAALAAAEAALRSAGQQADYTVVRAPFDGVITQRFVHVGEAVESGPPAPQPLIAMAAMDALRVDVVVPQSVIDLIRQSRSAVVYLGVGDGPRIKAQQIIVFPYADPATHTFRIRVELPPGTPGLHPGMTVKVAFAVGRTTRLLIPRSALVQRGELTGLYVLGADNDVMLRQVRLGHTYGNKVEVVAGVTAGERVVRDPQAAARYLAELHAAGKSS